MRKARRILGSVREEIRRQTFADRPRPVNVWFLGVCPNPKCPRPHPPVLRADREMKTRECCDCGTQLIFVMKQGKHITSTTRPGTTHYVYICVEDGTKCGPRFRAKSNDPIPVCRHGVLMQLAVRKLT